MWSDTISVRSGWEGGVRNGIALFHDVGEVCSVVRNRPLTESRALEAHLFSIMEDGKGEDHV